MPNAQLVSRYGHARRTHESALVEFVRLLRQMAIETLFDVLPGAVAIDAHGIDEFEANVHEVHRQLPGAEYSRTSGVDSHHQLYRYTWQITRDGEVLLPGFDVTEIDGDGKVARVLGFFGPLPETD